MYRVCCAYILGHLGGSIKIHLLRHFPVGGMSGEGREASPKGPLDSFLAEQVRKAWNSTLHPLVQILLSTLTIPSQRGGGKEGECGPFYKQFKAEVWGRKTILGRKIQKSSYQPHLNMIIMSRTTVSAYNTVCECTWGCLWGEESHNSPGWGWPVKTK